MIDAVEVAMYNLHVGNKCVSCDSERVKHKQIVSQGKGGKSVWRNLYAVCGACEVDVSKLDAMRQDKYGINFYMDGIDLYSLGLINEPTRDRLERYFKQAESRYAKMNGS